MASETVDARATRLVRAIEVSRRRGWTFVPAAASRVTQPALIAALHPRLRALGFVVIPASTPPSPSCVARLAGRHVAIVVPGARWRDRARAWMRGLATHSPRAHVVIDIGLEERMPPSARGTARQFQRARSAMHVGRLASGERWLRAALHSAHRRGDEPGEVEATSTLVDLLISRQAPWEARDVASLATSRLRTDCLRARCEVSLARALIACGELRQGDEVLNRVAADAAAAGTTAPASTEAVRAELLFWQGHFAAAHAAVSVVPAPSTTAALIAWAVGDTRQLDAVGTADDAGLAPLWRVAARGLLATAVGDTEALTAAARTMKRTGYRGVSVADGKLLRAVCCHLCLALDRRDDAWAALGPATVDCKRPTLLDRLHEWLRRACRPDRYDETVVAWVSRTGARGFERWGGGKTNMQILHVLPALLRVIDGAEDEDAGLRGCCAWLVTHGGAETAAFVSLEGHLLAASERWRHGALDEGLVRALIAAVHATGETQQGDESIAAPVRYAGSLAGVLVATRGGDRRADAADAVTTVAMLCAPAVRTRLDALQLRRDASSLLPEIVGISPAAVALREAVVRAAGTTFPVLIEGESGTGKELVARALHRLGPRRDRRFCPLNCAALADELVETELFGHSRGAFTGAAATRIGLFEEANGGTLFLDEVAELSSRTQAKLLRVLQEGEVRRVGENGARCVDVRVIAATNSSLREMVRRQSFRHDLLFRLAVVRIRVPPLAARAEDVPLLAQVFWRRLGAQARTQAALGPDALSELSRYAWPGNVRELQNVISALLVTAPARGRVGARHVRHVLAESGQGPHADTQPLEAARHTFERHEVAAALARNGGRRSPAAKELGMSRQGLVKAIKRLGLTPPPDEAGVA
ncbi:MAG TPA: sigma 54-interacting transcriptional regulator [Vicinamibacterales bacterium]|nr:sigma 54-interacting transcriptional regulator [Vicinamibacterales bacterium]